MATAMRLKQPDRVPVMCQPSIGFLLRQNPDVSPLDLWYDQSVYAETLCHITQRFGFDGVLTSMIGNVPLDEEATANIDLGWREGPRVTFKNGDVTVFCQNDLPRHVYADHPLPDIGDFDVDSIPESVQFQPVSNDLNAFVSGDPQERVRVISEIRRRVGPDMSVHGELYSPFDHFIELFGTENALIALLTEPEKSLQIMTRFAQAIARFAHEQIDAGVDAMKLSSPWTGQKFVSLDLYRQLVVPPQKLLSDACRERGVPIYCHTCGALDDRLEAVIDSGYSGLECLDPPPLGNVRLENAIGRVGDRAFIKGNVDPVNILLNGTVEQVVDDVRQRLDIGMQAPGFILSTACAIAPETPPQNLLALSETVHEFGRY